MYYLKYIDKKTNNHMFYKRYINKDLIHFVEDINEAKGLTLAEVKRLMKHEKIAKKCEIIKR